MYQGGPKNYHPFQLRQYNIIQTAKRQILILFEQFQRLLLTFFTFLVPFKNIFSFLLVHVLD